MKRFQFKLDPLLRLRKNQRDVCQQLLAGVLRHDSELAEQRNQTEADRRTQIEELRTLGSGGSDVDIDASAARRNYTVQLSGHLGDIDQRRVKLAPQIESCRQALVRADQAVRSLEKLAEKQLAEFIFSQERLEARDLEQTWQAIHAGEREPC